MATPIEQPSFIPKKPLSSPGMRVQSSVLGTLFFLVSGFVFVASLGAAVLVFFYQGYLKSSIVSKTATLKAEEAAFDPKTITDLLRLDSRINNASSLLQKHTTVLGLFTFLSEQTLRTVQFTNFQFGLGEKGQAQMTLTGQASDFATVALQSDQFNASTVLKNIVFSGIVVNATGGIKFDVKADLDPALISYAKNLTSTAAVPPQTGAAVTGQLQTPTPTQIQTPTPTQVQGTGAPISVPQQ